MFDSYQDDFFEQELDNNRPAYKGKMTVQRDGKRSPHAKSRTRAIRNARKRKNTDRDSRGRR